MNNWNEIVSDEEIQLTIKALEANNISVSLVANREEAKKAVLDLIPQESEVMTMTSVTLDETGIENEINNLGKYNSVKKQLGQMDRATQGRQMQQLGAAPEWVIGSVHAVTQDGQVLVTSNSGSQLPAYAYGADHVVWVVGVQKIVKDLQAGMARINEYVLPLESERARKAYGVEGSFVSKVLLFNREPRQGRITMVLVKEKLGY